MDLEALECFVVTADLLSFRRASEMLFMSQSALSRKISALEAELGVKLILRSKPNNELTEAGAAVLEKARQMVMLRDEMKEVLHASAGAARKTLRIGYLNLSQFSLLARATEVMRESRPDLNIVLERHSLPELRSLLREDRLDIIFDMCGEEDQEPECIYYQVSRGGLFAVVHRSHPLAGRAELSIRELSQEEWVTFRRSAAPRVFDRFIEICLEAGFSPKIAAYGDNMEEVVMLAGLGQGIAAMDETARILENQYVRFIPISNYRAQKVWYLCRNREKTDPVLSAVCRTIENLSERTVL